MRPFISGDGDSGEERQQGIWIAVIVEISRPDERRASKLGEVVEHQDPAAAPKSPNFKSGAEVGKAIFADRNRIVF